jgi:hypothetical protein
MEFEDGFEFVRGTIASAGLVVIEIAGSDLAVDAQVARRSCRLDAKAGFDVSSPELSSEEHTQL